MMLGKLCAVCLKKYVQTAFLCGSGNSVVECISFSKSCSRRAKAGFGPCLFRYYGT